MLTSELGNFAAAIIGAIDVAIWSYILRSILARRRLAREEKREWALWRLSSLDYFTPAHWCVCVETLRQNRK